MTVKCEEHDDDDDDDDDDYSGGDDDDDDDDYDGDDDDNISHPYPYECVIADDRSLCNVVSNVDSLCCG